METLGRDRMSITLKRARLCLSGALVGIALVSVVATLFGVAPAAHTEVLSATAGGVAAAWLVKIAHIV